MSSRAEASLKRSVGWMFFGQGAGYVLRVLYFILIARALGISQYGIVAAAFALVNLVAQYSRLGSGMVLLRYVSADHSRFSVYWGNVLLTTCALSALITVGVRFLAPHILDPGSAALVVFTSIGSCMFEQLTISSTQVFQAFQHMRFTAVLNLLTSLLRTIAAAGLLFCVHRATAVQWVVLSMIVSGIAALAAMIAVSVSFGRPKLDMQLFRSRAGEGVEYAFAASTSSAYDDLDKTMLSHYGMNAAVGAYAMAYRIIEMATMPITSIQLAAEPRMFAAGPEGIQESAALGNRLLSRSAIISGATAVLLFVAAPVLPLLVGRSFSEGVSALRWLCLIPLFRSVHHITGSVLTCSGKQRVRTINQLAAAAFNFLINLWLIPRHGWLGAAWASLLTDGALGGMNWAVLRFALRRDLARKAAVSPPSPELPHVPDVPGGNVAQADPLVSIIIPFYRQEAYLGATVESARRQTHPRIEIIVVDDGSPVSARSVLGEVPGVTILRFKNGGVAAARNRGFHACAGEFIIFLDSDDLLESDAVENHLKALRSNPSAGMSFGALRTIDKSGSPLAPPHICRARRDYVRTFLSSNPIGCPGAVMVRRAAFTKAGGFEEHPFRVEADYLLYLRIVTCCPIVRHTRCVVAYRQHEMSMSYDKRAMLDGTMAALRCIEPSLAPEHRRWLSHARRRWNHAFIVEHGMLYKLRSLYYSFHAMLTVPLSSYFRQEI